MGKETFKDIPGYIGLYQVSNFGRIMSLSNNNQRKERILKPSMDGWDYLGVSLCKKGKKKRCKIHQLVVMVFLNHKPDGTHKLVVNHIDFNKLNNNLSNLEIITQRQNTNKKHLKSSSKYTGVCWNNKRKKWKSSISINGKKINLGRFNSEIEASKAYEKALKKQ